MIAHFLQAGKTKVLAATGGMIAIIALADWYVGNRASLGLLYILPMMVGALVLAPFEIVALAILCSFLRSCFDLPSPAIEKLLRFVFAAAAYATSGLFITALIRNRRLMIEHLDKVSREQELRREAEEQLKILVESSPAAILTIAANGVVLAANRAASSLFLLPDGESLQGRGIRDYLPVLADALQLIDPPEPFRTAVQSQGRRMNGEIFMAHTWFSSYLSPEGMRLAAIVVDSTEEMRDREEQGLRQLMKGNRIAAAAVAHELRNLSAAISVVSKNLGEKHNMGQDEDFKALTSLVSGLERASSLELQSRGHESLSEVELQEVLDDLRIVIEPDWREISGAVRWQLPPRVPVVLADRQGLLQAFLNLVQNSLRAVQESSVRELVIEVSVEGQRARVRIEDTGPGISAPERLFKPFQPGADGTGLGLYVSRAEVRSYGGELRFEPRERGACFTIELQVVA